MIDSVMDIYNIMEYEKSNNISNVKKMLDASYNVYSEVFKSDVNSRSMSIESIKFFAEYMMKYDFLKKRDLYNIIRNQLRYNSLSVFGSYCIEFMSEDEKKYILE